MKRWEEYVASGYIFFILSIPNNAKKYCIYYNILELNRYIQLKDLIEGTSLNVIAF